MKLDPQGVGGALGGATTAYNQSQIAANRAQTQEEARKHQQRVLLYTLENMANPQGNLLTPKGEQGVTGVKANSDGSVRIDADLPGPAQQTTPSKAAPQQLQTSTSNVNTPSPAVSPAGAELLDQGTSANPLTLEGTTVTAQREPVQTTPVTQSTPTPSRPFDIRSIIPFL